MITLALDLSTKRTGFALFNDQELIKYGCIAAGSTNIYKRIKKMVQEIKKILDENKINRVIIEDVWVEDIHNNINTCKALLYLQGFICCLFDLYKLSPIFIYPSEWRKKCGIHTGRGIQRNSLKQEDINFVKSQFDVDVNDDVADAICIGFSIVGGEIKEPKKLVQTSGFEFL